MTFDFNRDWYFKKEGQKEKKVKLPHDAMLEEKRYPECANGVNSGYFPGGKYEYRKSFTVEKEDLDYDEYLLFEGIYRNSKIYVNNTLLKYTKYGFTEITVFISPYLKAGINEVRVEVDSSLYPSCRWYSGSGIYRPVTLIKNKSYAPKKLYVETVSYNPIVIKVTTEEEATVSIFDGDKLITSGKSGIFNLPSLELWNENNPKLYRCVSEIKGEKIECNFGIRRIEITSEKGLVINGERVLLRGGCLHSDNGILGAVSDKDADEGKVLKMKGMGFNAIRASHNMASRTLLDAADKYGMYVLDEAFDGWYTPKNYHVFSRDFYEEYLEVLKTMVERDYSHPSVIMYSVGNEVTETAEDKGRALLKEMVDYVHSLDSTRLVTCGINVLLDVYCDMGIGVYSDKKEYKREKTDETKGYKEKKSGSAFFNFWTQKLGRLMFFMSKGKRAGEILNKIAPNLDIVGLNYASSRYVQDAENHPQRLMLGTETLVEDLPYNWDKVKKYPSLIGDFVWSAFDYLGETCMGITYSSYPGLPLLSNQGVIDITGYASSEMYFMRTVWGFENSPYIAVSPLNHSGETPQKGSWHFSNGISSWCWGPYEGKKTHVDIFSSSPYVKLMVNDEVIGIKRVKDYRVSFSIKYKKGVIKAFNLDENQRELSSTILESEKGEKRLKLTNSSDILQSGSDEKIFLNIEFTDEEGKLLPYVEQNVTINTNGDSAILLAFGSALYKSDELYSGNSHHSYQGRALAILGATDKKGITEFTIESENVEKAKIKIKVE